MRDDDPENRQKAALDDSELSFSDGYRVKLIHNQIGNINLTDEDDWAFDFGILNPLIAKSVTEHLQKHFVEYPPTLRLDWTWSEHIQVQIDIPLTCPEWSVFYGANLTRACRATLREHFEDDEHGPPQKLIDKLKTLVGILECDLEQLKEEKASHKKSKREKTS